MPINLLTETNFIDNNTLMGAHNPFSIAFYIADLPIVWYGILSMIGYGLAIFVFLITIKTRYKIAVDPAFYYIFIALPCILFGARFWSFVIGDCDWNSTPFFDFRQGGLAVQGGVIFGVLSAIIYFPLILLKPKYHKRVVDGNHVYIQKPSLWLYADAIIPTILLGQAIGRWGNFFNGEIFGELVTLDPSSPNSLSWLKIIMPGVYNHMIAVGNTSNGLIAGALYQPLFLYESMMNIFLFLNIYIMMPLFRQIKAGVISGMYFTGYGVIRFINESLRYKTYAFAGTYYTNGALLIIGILIIIFAQFIFPKIRKYKIWKILKQYITRKKIANTLKTSPKTWSEIVQANIRSKEEGIYYDNR